MEWYISAIIILVILFALILVRMPVAFALGLTAVIGIYAFLSPTVLPMAATVAWHVSTNFVLICLPLFLLMGEIMFRTRIGEGLFDFLHKVFGSIPAGLAMASIIASAFMGAITGIALAVVAIVGSLAYPEMKRRSYSPGMSASVLAASSGLGLVIPPSVPLILYGLITGESIGRLFMGGIMPGLVVAALFCVYCGVASKLGWGQAPAIGKVPLKEKAKALKGVWPSILLIIVVLGGIYTGVVTPTEAAALGCAGAIVIAAIFRTITRENMKRSFIEATRMTCAIFIIIIGAKAFGYMLSTMGIPHQLAAWVVSIQVPPPVVMVFIMLVFIVMGMIMDVTPIILIMTPVFYPLVLAMGWDPIWFAIMVVINMMMAVITPPIGLCLFLTGDITGVPLPTIIRGTLPFLGLMVISLIILYIFPQLALWLPNMMFNV